MSAAQTASTNKMNKLANKLTEALNLYITKIGTAAPASVAPVVSPPSVASTPAAPAAPSVAPTAVPPIASITLNNAAKKTYKNKFNKGTNKNTLKNEMTAAKYNAANIEKFINSLQVAAATAPAATATAPTATATALAATATIPAVAAAVKLNSIAPAQQNTYVNGLLSGSMKFMQIKNELKQTHTNKAINEFLESKKVKDAITKRQNTLNAEKKAAEEAALKALPQQMKLAQAQTQAPSSKQPVAGLGTDEFKKARNVLAASMAQKAATASPIATAATPGKLNATALQQTNLAKLMAAKAAPAGSSPVPSPSSGNMSKYNKMKSVGLPEGAVRQKMQADGLNQATINAYFKPMPGGGRTTYNKKRNQRTHKNSKRFRTRRNRS